MSSLMKRAAPTLINVASDASSAVNGIIFDCDGVLFDSKEANTAYYNHIRLAVHLPPLTESEAAYSHMVSADEAIENLVPPELLAEAMEAKNSTRYRDTFMGMMEPADHVYRFLDAMKGKGVPLALCTNRSDSVHHVLRHFDMDAYFSPVMTITHALPKPDPQGLLEVLKIWDTPADSVIFLGDSLVDQQAAAAAEIPFWSFNSPSLAAQVHVSGFREMEEIVQLMLMR